MAKGRVTPQGKRVVQSALDSDSTLHEALESTLVPDSMILQSENQNTPTALSDGKNDHSESETAMQSAQEPIVVQSELAQVLQATAALDYAELTEHMKTVHTDPSASISSQDAPGHALHVESMIPALDNNSSLTAAPDASNADYCEMIGCIAHNTRSVDVDIETFSFRVHFTPVVKKKVQLSGFNNLLDHATESVGRKVQQMIRESRKKTGKDGFPSGRIVDIDTNMTFARTIEDEQKEIAAMSDAQAQHELDLLLRKMALLKHSRGWSE